MLKVIKGISTPILNELFDRNEGNNYNLRNPFDFSLPIVKTVFSNMKTLSRLGSKQWKIVSPKINVVESLLEFKNTIRLLCVLDPMPYSSEWCL